MNSWPIELRVKLCSYLTPSDVFSLLHVNTGFYNTFNDDFIWQKLCGRLKLQYGFIEKFPFSFLEEMGTEFDHCQNLQNYLAHMYVQTRWQKNISNIQKIRFKKHLKLKDNDAFDFHLIDCDGENIVMAFNTMNSIYSTVLTFLSTVNNPKNKLGELHLDFDITDLKLSGQQVYICSRKSLISYSIQKNEEQGLNLSKCYEKELSSVYMFFTMAVSTQYIAICNQYNPSLFFQILNPINGELIQKLEIQFSGEFPSEIFLTNEYLILLSHYRDWCWKKN